MIQTSYFGSTAPKERKVCIAKWNRWWSGPRASAFAPSNPKAENWAEAYRQDLKSRFPTAESLLEYLLAIEQATPNPILCCFEKNGEECHRRILADYIQEKLGLNVPEWQPAQSPTQLSLLG
ncbi:DUF488 family protein [Oleidesulfovibrio sp.]|uniref:DUF488 family protein, N3 subclade n=1 Tax=Oleidesulfovibrio sp. TaxID=2909707 RepID=UPI003A8BD486